MALAPVAQPPPTTGRYPRRLPQDPHSEEAVDLEGQCLRRVRMKEAGDRHHPVATRKLGAVAKVERRGEPPNHQTLLDLESENPDRSETLSGSV